MLNIVIDWSKRVFSDPELSILMLTLFASLGFFWFFGDVLAPFVASVVLAYVLDGGVRTLRRYCFPRILAVVTVFLLCFSVFLAGLFWLFPLIWREISALVHALPSFAGDAQVWLGDLPQYYPDLISVEQVDQITDVIHSEVAKMGKFMVSSTVAMIPGALGVVTYMIIVPFMVFFLLKDGHQIFTWVSAYFPERRRLVRQVWLEVDEQMARYIRGKLIEIFLVSLVTSAYFIYWGLNYAILLGVIVGISTLIPYVGAVVVTIPVLILVLVQWGTGYQSLYLFLGYALIHLVDAQLLVPLLFSEALKLHPLAIFVAIMVFGGLWGFWGVFFAIPLATVVKAVLSAWADSSYHLDDVVVS